MLNFELTLMCKQNPEIKTTYIYHNSIDTIHELPTQSSLLL